MTLQETVKQFKMLASLQMPNLVKPSMLVSSELEDDYALLTYKLPNPMPIDELIDEMEDQMELILLYHMVPSKDTEFGHRCCSYSNPRFEHMFKLNSSTDEHGMCNTVDVTVYASLEYMCEELRSELRRISTKGKMLMTVLKARFFLTSFNLLE